MQSAKENNAKSICFLGPVFQFGISNNLKDKLMFIVQNPWSGMFIYDLLLPVFQKLFTWVLQTIVKIQKQMKTNLAIGF